jgi:hypothetical protein
MEELNKKEHKVRNMINVKHRISKEPLPLFFVDLEPQNNNKELFNLPSFCKTAKFVLNHPDAKILSYNAQDAKIMATQNFYIFTYAVRCFRVPTKMCWRTTGVRVPKCCL